MGKRKKVGGGRVAELERRQRRLWNVAIALCIIIFFVLSVWWIGIEMGFFATPGPKTVELMEYADLAAIFVFAIELYSRYRKTPDKLVFLKKNWLEILVLLPVGVMFRAFKSMESVEAVRSAGLALRVEKEGLVLPELAAAGRAVAHIIEGAHKWVMHFSVISDFFAMVSENVGNALSLAGKLFR